MALGRREGTLYQEISMRKNIVPLDPGYLLLRIPVLNLVPLKNFFLTFFFNLLKLFFPQGDVMLSLS